MPGNGRILIVDDEPLIRKSLYETLRFEGYEAEMASDGEEALQKIERLPIDIVIADIKMPKFSGIDLLKQVREKHPEIPVILITGYGTIDQAVEAMRLGAADYITKPIMDGEIKIVIKKLFEQKNLIEENIALRQQLARTGRDTFHQLIGKHEKMQKIYTLIETIADTKATLLIKGESGTGKRLVALAIHANDPARKDKPFVEVSCAAIPETLLESELFGHVKGAFTGAIKDRMGRFELADGGTILLDEIDTFSPALQVKLLRVLQEGEFERVGDTKTIRVDVRIIAATNQNLEELIEQGKFREDLYYRLNVIAIGLPSLRERKEDIPVLIEHFLKKFSVKNKKKFSGVSDGFLKAIEAYQWPGNVRELENVMERATIVGHGDLLTEGDLPDLFHQLSVSAEGGETTSRSLKEMLGEPEREMILRTLQECHWNRKKAAALLGVNRTTLYNKMRKYNLFGGRGEALQHV
ncbi:MAG: sigma-54-dependent Fis family transcriptional regulator [Candidatus Omnitrophica bacterium]|nr:sigma-54-dependent Fis family transcriptional regulator [Candidatus Omnitrophota bacterium]